MNKIILNQPAWVLALKLVAFLTFFILAILTFTETAITPVGLVILGIAALGIALYFLAIIFIKFKK